MKNKFLKSIFSITFISLLGFSSLVISGTNSKMPFAPTSTYEFELIQSSPDETNLSSPNLRFAKDVWIEMIRKAQTSIDMGQFYFANKLGEPLEPVILELEAAGRRGVHIRIAVSNKMVVNDPTTYERIKKFPNTEVKLYDLAKLTGGIIHAKYWVIDQNEIFIGSHNFDWRALNQIQELGFRTTNPSAVNQLAHVFETDWMLASVPELAKSIDRTKPKNQDFSKLEIEVVASPDVLTPGTVRFSEEVLVEEIQKAKKLIRIQLLTYSTLATSHNPKWLTIENELKAAIARGAKVEMILASWMQDKKAEFQSLQELAKTPGFEIRIATIPEHSKGAIPYARVIHSKFMTVDSKTLWLGTSNWSRDYFYNTRGVEAVIRRSDATAQVDDLFERLWKSTYVKSVLSLTANTPPLSL